jgi:hypothetical protein
MPSPATQVKFLFYLSVVCTAVCLAGVSAGYWYFALPLLINAASAVIQRYRLTLVEQHK